MTTICVCWAVTENTAVIPGSEGVIMVVAKMLVDTISTSSQVGCGALRKVFSVMDSVVLVFIVKRHSRATARQPSLAHRTRTSSTRQSTAGPSPAHSRVLGVRP